MTPPHISRPFRPQIPFARDPGRWPGLRNYGPLGLKTCNGQLRCLSSANGAQFLSPVRKGRVAMPPRHAAQWVAIPDDTVPYIAFLRAAQPDEAYFWGVHSGAELDLLMIKDGHRIGVEFKREDAPRLTRSMRTAFTDLELERLLVIYPGSRPYQIADHIHALPLGLIHDPEQRGLPG